MTGVLGAVPQAGQTAIPDANGVDRPGNGVTPPHLVTRVNPQYTQGAMRAKLQGIVVLSCVVLADGTVGEVHVVRSLDKGGLDDQAVSALKQWRFVPGMKEGKPVPIAVTVNMAFSLPGFDPPSTWPDAFVEDAAVTAESWAWKTEGVDAGVLHVRLAHPQDWRVAAVNPPTRVATIYSGDGRAGLHVEAPQPAPSALTLPLPIINLQMFVDRLDARFRTPGGTYRRLGSGQAQIGNRWWIWTEAEASAPAPVSAPPAAQLAADTGLFPTGHHWSFTTVVSNELETVTCIAVRPIDTSDAEAAAAIAAVAKRFAVMMERVEIRPR